MTLLKCPNDVKGHLRAIYDYFHPLKVGLAGPCWALLGLAGPCWALLGFVQSGQCGCVYLTGWLGGFTRNFLYI